MLEGGGHPVDLALRQVTARSLVAPCRDGLADLLRNGARLGSVEVEISGIVHCQLEGSAIVLFADRRAEDARLDLDRHGVEVVCRREPPTVGSRIQEAVIAKMVVGVGDEEVENHGAPKPCK